ncbi:hypothetical protein ITJ57_07000 [Plantibacter sp. VKM Ac-2880]|uniref:hypothetical protein n=1 Tax=Plantibacter sp. VKM Ac-2880 TaxID=2783827 RepID=UPI00189064CD|nr:hypothetical protein [Plantibacter sp. VKM Ac-2880]MBF4568516.1 hypothetical protein [Plantibacter sp. VKM Ac-2880]
MTESLPPFYDSILASYIAKETLAAYDRRERDAQAEENRHAAGRLAELIERADAAADARESHRARQVAQRFLDRLESASYVLGWVESARIVPGRRR